MQLIDLSHTISDGLATYPGLPAPVVCDYWSRKASEKHYAPGTGFHIGRIDMVANTGTYLDAPFHRFEEGADVADLKLEQVSGLPGCLVHAPQDQRAIGPEHFKGMTIKGRAVLVHTGWARHWGSQQYFRGHPYLTAAAAELLRRAGAVLVGIDSLNIDATHGGERPVHSILLGAGILIVEHLCRLDQLGEPEFRFHAVPVKVRGLGSFPVRAFAEVHGPDLS